MTSASSTVSVAELGGDDPAAALERDAPDQRHRRDLLALAAPAADDLLGDVHAPLGMVLGDVGRVVGPGVELARLVAGREGHVAEELEAGVGARGRGDVGASRPAAVREPVDLARRRRGRDRRPRSRRAGRRRGTRPEGSPPAAVRPGAARRRSGRSAWRGSLAGRYLDEHRHRAVVDQLDVHVRAEDPALGVQAARRRARRAARRSPAARRRRRTAGCPCGCRRRA